MNRSNTETSILEVSQLTKHFRHGSEEVAALDAVSFNVAKGEFVAVMGASGSGKSTLLHLIAGLARPDQGEVRVNGMAIHKLSRREAARFRRRQIGLIFQAFNLIPTLSGVENIALPLLIDGQGQADPQKVAHLVEELGVAGTGRRRPDAMSGGEQQRIAIGRALITNPAVILADEPTGNLDSVSGKKLCQTFRRLCSEHQTTVLMVTHNPVVAYAASRILILKDGRLVSQASRETYPTVQDLTHRYVSILEQETDEVAA